MQPLLHIEARTGFLDTREISMTENLRFGIQGVELLEKLCHRGLLQDCASVGGIAMRVETALVADADAVEVVTLDMGTRLARRTTRINRAVLREVEVVADVGPVVLLNVAAAKGLYREITVGSRCRTMDY